MNTPKENKKTSTFLSPITPPNPLICPIQPPITPHLHENKKNPHKKHLISSNFHPTLNPPLPPTLYSFQCPNPHLSLSYSPLYPPHSPPQTLPDSPIVSSVFFMCLPDRVLVYGDCAINTDPSSAELAAIALSSAHTAQAFGIQPRVAMLSYATGDSNQGLCLSLFFLLFFLFLFCLVLLLVLSSFCTTDFFLCFSPDSPAFLPFFPPFSVLFCSLASLFSSSFLPSLLTPR